MVFVGHRIIYDQHFFPNIAVTFDLLPLISASMIGADVIFGVMSHVMESFHFICHLAYKHLINYVHT